DGASKKQAVVLSVKREIRQLLTVGGRRPALPGIYEREKRERRRCRATDVPNDTRYGVEQKVSRRAVDVAADCERRVERPSSALDRYFLTSNQEQAGRVRKRGGRVVGQPHERAAH